VPADAIFTIPSPPISLLASAKRRALPRCLPSTDASFFNVSPVIRPHLARRDLLIFKVDEYCIKVNDDSINFHDSSLDSAKMTCL
jgi:hypothetical protein